jgi:DNA (cytosine-5)-methyltransferase 1
VRPGAPWLLDLFCGAGGASVGYYRAGFNVCGVDIEPQPHYPFKMAQMDALDYIDRWGIDGFDAVHASPPCQAHSDLQKQSKLEYPDFIGVTREALIESRLPYVIENVEGAPLIDPVKLCGASDAFPELRVIRHRLFESNVDLAGTPCPDKHPLVFTFDKRKPHFGLLDQDTAYVQVTGGGNCSVKNAREAMGIDWMTKKEVNEAIPPAYAEWVGKQLLDSMSIRKSASGGKSL